MFEFYDPCESCFIPLDSPGCEHCPYSEEYLAVSTDPEEFEIITE